MKQRLGGRLNDEILRELFFKRLRHVVKTILITADVTDFDRAAEAADKVHEHNLVNAVTTNPVSRETEVAATTSSNCTSFKVAQLINKMSNLVPAV